MNILDINGKMVKVDVRPGNYPLRAKCRSDFQKRIQSILTDRFINVAILEEFTIPGTGMSVDFFIPSRKLVIECQGQQHQGYIPFFHGGHNKAKFHAQKVRDGGKRDWAELNGFVFVEFLPDDKEDAILEKLKGL